MTDKEILAKYEIRDELSPLVQKMQDKLQQLYPDLLLLEASNALYTSGTGNMGQWGVMITKQSIIFNRGYQASDELVLMVNKIRQDYFNVY